MASRNTRRPIRVAYLHEFASLNGGERSFLNLLANRDRVGPIVSGPPGPLAARVRDAGVEYIDFAVRGAGRRRAFDQVAHEWATRLPKVDLIHGNSLSIGEYSARIGAILGAPAISHVRDIQRLTRPRVARLNGNDALIAVSNATRAHLLESGIDADRVHVVVNGIDPDFADVEPATALWQGDDGRAPLVVNIGQICLRKAQDRFVDAIAPVLAQRPHCHAAIVGERYSQKSESIEFERRLHDDVHAAGLTDRIHFLGRRDDVASILKRASVLLHTAHQEPLGRVLIEAQCCHLPIVATAVGGTAEIIWDGHSGYVVAPEDTAALSRRVATILDDPELGFALGSAGRAIAIERFDPARSAAAVVDIYDRVVRQREEEAR